MNAKRVLVFVLIALLTIGFFGCFGGKKYKPSRASKRVSSCNYSITYSAAELNAPVLAKKRLKQCATITDLTFYSMEGANTSIYQKTLKKYGMLDWVVVILIAPGNNNIIGLVPPKLAQKVIALKGGQTLKIKGKYTGKRMYDYIYEHVKFIFIDDIQAVGER